MSDQPPRQPLGTALSACRHAGLIFANRGVDLVDARRHRHIALRTNNSVAAAMLLVLGPLVLPLVRRFVHPSISILVKMLHNIASAEAFGSSLGMLMLK
jgi:hypothetical protein